MRFLAFLLIAFKRLRSRAFLSVVLVVCMAMTIAVMACIPVFAGGVSRRIMQQELARKTKSLNRPPFSVRFYALPRSRQPMTLDDADYARDWIGDMLVRGTGLPIRTIFAQNESPSIRMRPKPDDPFYSGEDLATTQVVVVEGIERHLEIVEGAPLGQAATDEHLHVWVLESFANRLGLRVGERYDLAYFFSDRVDPLTVEIAGFWRPLDANDTYWYRPPEELYRENLLTTREQYQRFISPIAPEGTGFNFWYYVLDDRNMNLDRAAQYVAALDEIVKQVGQSLPNGRMDYAPSAELIAGHERKTSLSIFLLGFSVPLVGILILFIGSISTMVARYQMQETAMLASRGTSRSQIMALTVVDTLLVLAAAAPLGVGLGMLLARLLGYSLSFMAFVQREPLAVHLASLDWRLVGVAGLINLGSRLVPAFLSTRLSVVTFEQQSARRSSAVGVTRVFLLLLLTAVTAYGYRQLVQRGILGLSGWQGEDPLRDPLLLLAPTLYLFTAPLLASEFFVLIMRPLAVLGRLLPSVTGYLGFLSLGREGGQYRTPTYLLVLCLSLGVFYASLALSADIWLVDRLQYQVGADVSFEPGVNEETGMTQQDMAYLLPDTEYMKLEGVTEATRVGEYAARAPGIGSSSARLRLIGIERVSFPRVAYFRPDYAEASLGELMNLLAIRPNGIIVPKEAAELLDLEMDDEVTLEVLIQGVWRPIKFQMVGTFEYWPTVYPQEMPAVIAELNYLHVQTAGEFPHNIWLRTEGDERAADVVNRTRTLGIEPLKAKDLRTMLHEDKQRLERVGLFGLFSISFVAGAVLAGAGLLIYNSASMSGQAYRFAVLQAMGLKRSEVIRVVSVEYVFTLLYGMAVGAALGIVGARLYVPFFPLSEGEALPVPPFVPFVDWSATTWMAAGMALALLAVEAVILVRLVRTKVFEALRLGARE